MRARIKVGTNPERYFLVIGRREGNLKKGESLLIKEAGDCGARPFQVIINEVKDINDESLFFASRL